MGCQKSVGVVTSRSRLTEGYDAWSLARLRWRRPVWSGRLSTWQCVAAWSRSCSAAGRHRPSRSRSWCCATSLRCCAASIHGLLCSLPTTRCLRRCAVCSHGCAGRACWSPRDPAALAPADGGPALDLPVHSQALTCCLRPGAAAGRQACPRESAVGLPAHPRRAVAPWLAGVGQLDPHDCARPRP